MLRTYRTCNPTVKFLKYKFNNKSLDGVILLRVTPDITMGNASHNSGVQMNPLAWQKTLYNI